MKKYILIEADYNDADYVSSMNEIDDECIELIRPVIEQLQLRKQKLEETKNWNEWRHNWVTSEYGKNEESPYRMYVETGLLTQEEVDVFYDFVPYGEHGVHTITSVRIIEVVEDLF